MIVIRISGIDYLLSSRGEQIGAGLAVYRKRDVQKEWTAGSEDGDALGMDRWLFGRLFK